MWILSREPTLLPKWTAPATPHPTPFGANATASATPATLPVSIKWFETPDGNVAIHCRHTLQCVAVVPRHRVNEVMAHARCNEETALRALVLHHQDTNNAIIGLMA